MIEFNKVEGLGSNDEGNHSLSWDYLPYKREFEWEPIATVCCGNNHLATISPKVHTVSDEGILNPSYVCPRDNCNFHEWVKFVGWSND